MRRDYLESRQQAHVLNPNYSVIFYKGERFGKGLKASRLFIHMTEQEPGEGLLTMRWLVLEEEEEWWEEEEEEEEWWEEEEEEEWEEEEW